MIQFAILTQIKNRKINKGGGGGGRRVFMYISSCHMYVYMHIMCINIVFTCVRIPLFKY